MATQELQSLTPLRGIAAIWVICFHYIVVYFSAFHPEQISSVLNKGYLAVDMFFMLSGFVLSHVYWGTFTSETADAGHYWKFMGARVARLYPLHLFNLCQFLVATLAFAVYQYGSAGEFNAIPVHGARSLTALLANVAMLQGLKASQLAWNYPAWSISIEFLAYAGASVDCAGGCADEVIARRRRGPGALSVRPVGRRRFQPMGRPHYLAALSAGVRPGCPAICGLAGFAVARLVQNGLRGCRNLFSRIHAASFRKSGHSHRRGISSRDPDNCHECRGASRQS